MSALRVALNAEPMLRRTPTGVGVYTYSLCRAFAAQGRAEQVALFHAARVEPRGTFGQAADHSVANISMPSLRSRR